MRVFLDTNVIVSAFATRGLCADILQVILAEHELVLGEAVLQELSRVLPRKLGVPPGIAREAGEFLRGQAEVVADATPLGLVIDDPADVAIVEQAVAGHADVLITGDRHLLELEPETPVRVLSPRGFWNLIRSEASRPRRKP